MSAEDDIRASSAPADVIALERPPVRQSTVVRSDVEHTFTVFVREIALWWPVVPFSIGAGDVRDVTFEQRTKGRVYETWQDGSERDWGTVLEWDPPHGFTMSWNITGAPTEVELTFTPTPEGTKVDLEHRGWDRLSQADLQRACALPGGYLGGSFHAGWARILSLLTARAESSPAQPKGTL